MTVAQTDQPPNLQHPFVEWLERLRGNSGAMANLRRGLGKPPGTVAAVHKYVQGFLAECPNETQRNREDAMYAVASLWAFWHQGKDPEKSWSAPANIGVSLGASVLNDPESKDSLEKRFTALLNSHSDDLPQRLRHAVGLLRGKDIPVDWSQLLRDLGNWDHPDRFVQRQWAKGFWATDRKPESTESNSDDATAA